METAEFGTNTNPNTMNNLLLINSKIKKKPHNITIKNYNPNEPKTKQSQILYSDKQNYRKYKTKIEAGIFFFHKFGRFIHKMTF